MRFVSHSIWAVLLLLASLTTSSARAEVSPETTPPAPATETKVKTPELEALRAEKERLELEQAVQRQRHERAISELEVKKRAIVSQLELDAAQRQQQLSKLEAETERLKAERAAAEQQLALEVARRKLELSTIESDLEMAKARRKARKHVVKELTYPKQPLQDGVLRISDRRVSLNGPITMETADEITRQLHFFNNQSPEYPIFIVIDYSPGGSVMAGYRILKAMEASEAPIHVLVKSFAASMAAVIASRAEHSYAFPNAILLHHQVSGMNFGNLRQQQQRLHEAQEWSQRLLGPVHQKMGISHDQLIQKMYEHDPDGNWKEFADRAVALKWIDHVVQDVRETGIVSLEDDGNERSARPQEQRDADGRSYMMLPRLMPSDYWFIYNPDGYYRIEPPPQVP